MKHHGPLVVVGFQQHPYPLHRSSEMPKYPHSTLSAGSVWHSGSSAVGRNKLQL